MTKPTYRIVYWITKNGELFTEFKTAYERAVFMELEGLKIGKTYKYKDVLTFKVAK